MLLDQHTESALLSVDRLCCSNAMGEPKPLLEDISFHIGKQEHLAIVGHSGAGKSTLLACILAGPANKAALTVRGKIVYAEQNLLAARTVRNWRRLRREIGWIPQDPDSALNPKKTVRNQLLSLICARLGNSRTAADGQLKTLFESVGQGDLHASLGRYPSQFSGGELQRILVFHAMVGKPSLVLADEPTTALDDDNKKIIMRMMMDLIDTMGATLVLSSHDYDPVREYCKQYVCLDNGKLVETGPVSQLQSRVVPSRLSSLLHDYDRLNAQAQIAVGND